MKHGHIKRINCKRVASKTYRAWQNMKKRCDCQLSPDYKYYGGRGIKVCDRWYDFINFLEDMGEDHESLTLDRIDSNGDYCKENCRWVDRKIQSRNRDMLRNLKGTIKEMMLINTELKYMVRVMVNMILRKKQL